MAGGEAVDTGQPGPTLFAPRQAGLLAVQGWLASRLILVIVALGVTWTHDRSLAETLARWDVNHFAAIATEGYETVTEAAFFPGLPLVMRLFSLIGSPPLVTGLLINLVASGMAAWALYRLAGESIPGTVAVWTWSFAPMTVFTFAGYSEASFCAFAFWAFYQATRDHWPLAAGLAGAACGLRVSGLFLIGALGLVGLCWRRATWVAKGRRLIWLVIPTAVLGAYTVFLRLRFGSWTVWFDAQSEGWGRSFHWPWEAIATTLNAAGFTAPANDNSVMFRWELLAWIIGLVVTMWCLRRGRWAEAGWVSVQLIALSCQVWLFSLSRTVLLWFPIYLGVAHWASRPDRVILRRLLLGLGLILETTTMMWWAHRFFTGAWSS